MQPRREAGVCDEWPDGLRGYVGPRPRESDAPRTVAGGLALDRREAVGEAADSSVSLSERDDALDRPGHSAGEDDADVSAVPGEPAQPVREVDGAHAGEAKKG